MMKPEEGKGEGAFDGPFVFPDSVYEPRGLDGAAFLYFDSPLLLPTPPVVVTTDAFKVLEVVDARKPQWAPSLDGVLGAWNHEMAGWQEVEKALEPLRPRYISAMLAYPADQRALRDVDDLIAAAGLSLSDAAPVADPICACGELVRHIFLEAWLEHDQDVESLYEYCERVFSDPEFPALLVRSYFFRALVLARFEHLPGVLLLNNPRLITLLGSLPVEGDPLVSVPAAFDAITWELFRQILSPYVDPLSYERSEALADILANRTDELQAYRRRCEQLADEIRGPVELGELSARVARYVRLHITDEIGNLLRLNSRARSDYINAVLEDEKTWASTFGSIAALATGHPALSVGAGIGAVASLGTKALRTARERRETLRTNDFRIVYRMSGV